MNKADERKKTMIAWRSTPNNTETHIVLIASQDAEMVSVWEMLFEQKNCRVVVEATPRNTVQTSRLLAPTLIVLDLDISDEDRLALCKGLRATTDGTLLLLAPRRSEIDLSNYHFAGVNEIIPTPISPMALLIKSMAWLVRQEWFIPQSKSVNSYV
jgi:two-component system, OmpR family, response regulator MtrA